MFNLEHEIAQWRRQMIAGGIKSCPTLDELESHLREETERLIRRGVSDQAAFVLAVQQIGSADLLKNEFKKVRNVSIVWEWIMISIGSIVIAFGLFLTAVTIYQCLVGWGDRIVASVAVLCSVLVACGWRHAVPLLPAIASARKRWLAGLSAMVLGFGLTAVFANVILPYFERSSNGDLPAIALWAVFLIAASVCAGLGLLMNERERENLGMKKSVRGRRMSVAS